MTAISAAIQVILNQWHRLGSVLAGQFQLDEAIQLLETLIATDLIGAGGDDTMRAAETNVPVLFGIAPPSMPGKQQHAANDQDRPRKLHDCQTLAQEKVSVQVS